MGLKNSKNEVIDLKEQIKLEVAKLVDPNSDGVVTRKEFLEFVKISISTGVDVVNASNQLIIDELKKEVELLKQERDELLLKREETRSITLETTDKTRAVENIQVGVSGEILHQYVKNLLENPDINIKYLPDKVESGIYETVFQVLLTLLHKTLESNTIRLLGHKLRIIVEPEPQTS